MSYMIRRFYNDDSHPNNRRVIASGLTLDEAREHCNDPETQAPRDPETGIRPWFDGFEEES